VTYIADVSIESQVNDWAADVKKQLDTDHIPPSLQQRGYRLAAAASSLAIAASGEDVRRLLGRRLSRRARLSALLMKANEGAIVNTASVNGFWASIGPGRPHTAYCAAKFGGEGLHRSLDDRPCGECAAHQGPHRDARPYRHRDCRQFAQRSSPATTSMSRGAQGR